VPSVALLQAHRLVFRMVIFPQTLTLIQWLRLVMR